MGKTEPLVTIVIPCYNYGNFLEEAIDSCLSSTYKNIEIIVVNDGSQDPLTVKVLNRLNKPKTFVIHQNNKGSSAARNRGIAEGRGKYILPLDADDKIASSYIEEAVEVLEKKPEVGFVTCWYQCFGDENKVIKVPPFDFSKLMMKNTVCVCSLFRKKAWEQAGGYNERMMGYEDWDFWISIAERGWTGCRIPKVLFHYRKHSGSKYIKSRKNHQKLVKQIRDNHPGLFADENLKRDGNQTHKEGLFMVPDQDMLTADHVLSIVKNALNKRQPLSLVRVGDGENVVLAQDTVMPVEKVLQIGWAKEANKGRKGVALPNLKLRDQMAAAIRKADIVGIPYLMKDPILAPQSIKRPLTDAVFKHLKIRPKRVCHTFVNRTFGKDMNFWKLLRGKRILLVSSWAESVKPILEQKPYEVTICSMYNFTDYRQIPQALKFIKKRKDKFDIALVSCGVNAVVLCPEIAEITGKVALDFGKSLMFIVNEQTKPNDPSRKR